MMFGLFKRAEPRPHDEIADLRAGLAALVKRALQPENAGYFCVSVFNTKIRGIPTGDWRVTVERISEAPEA